MSEQQILRICHWLQKKLGIPRHNSKRREANGTMKKTLCDSCGEWLEGFDQCSECGRINKWCRNQ